MFDIVVLTDSKYVNPIQANPNDADVVKEDQILMEACQELGLLVDRKSWDDPDFDWSLTRSVIFRTTWDYFDRFAEFEVWLEKARKVTQFINSKELVYWNIDKRYLLELEKRGAKIVPTYVVEQGQKKNLKEIADANSWHEIVIKPTISASSRDTHHLPDKKYSSLATQAMFDALCEQKTMMIQPFLSRVVTEGELSLIVIEGKVTHGVRKLAKSGDYRVQSDFGGSIQIEDPDQAAIDFAENTVRQCPTLPLYARVDLIKDQSDEWNLGEMELIEPELWFRLNPESAKSLSHAIVKRLDLSGTV